MTRRPNGASARRPASKRLAAAHLEHHVDRLAVVRLQDRRLQVIGSRIDRDVGAKPPRQLALLLGRREPDHPAGAHPLRELHGERAGAPGGGLDDHGLALLEAGGDAQQAARREPLQQERGGLLVRDLVRNRHQDRLVDGHLLRVAAVGQERRDSPPVGRPAGDLAARDQRQLLLGEIVVSGHVGVGEVDAGARRPRPRPRRPPARGPERPSAASTSGPPNSSIWIARMRAGVYGGLSALSRRPPPPAAP